MIDLIDMLPRLRNGLDGKIEKTLRVSYNGLNDKKDRAIFRHIACLFNGEEVNDIKLLLEDSGLDVNIGLKNLVDKSLIHVRRGIVEMHSLLQEMGKEIVRAQSNDPGEREFLMDSKDICDLLEDNTGTKKILGITLDMDEIDELHIHENAFKGMRNLQFLKIYSKEGYQKRLTTNKWDQEKGGGWQLQEGFDYLPHKIRLLRLDGYPRGYMPCNFRPENLVKLQMQESNIEKLWEGIHIFRWPPISRHLIFVVAQVWWDFLPLFNISISWKREQPPTHLMAMLPHSWERLFLSDIPSLVEFPSSIQNFTKLFNLGIEDCLNLETLPTGINFQNLYQLNLSGCSRLKTFPNISTNVQQLYLARTGIEEVPWWLKNFSKLRYMNMEKCRNLETLPTGINLKSLNTLFLSGCSRLRSFPEISTNISELCLSETAIKEVPWRIENFTKLRYITMKKCSKLTRVSVNIYKLKHLTANFSDCGALTEASWNDSPSEVAMATHNIHSKFPIQTLDEAFSSDPYIYQRQVGFTFKFLNLDPEALLHNQSIIFNSMVLSGEEVPSYFTHQTTGTSSLANIPLLHTSLSQQFFKFRACAVVVFDSKPIISSSGVHIHVNCRFKDRFGNSFDSFGQLHDFWTRKTDSHLFILDCQGNYDHVDMQIHIKKIWMGPYYRNDSTFSIRGWGIRLLEECSSLENRLGNPNTLPHVCEADEDNLVNNSEECL